MFKRLALVGLVAFSGPAMGQAGSNQWGSWSTVRVGGTATTTLTPAAGSPFIPQTFTVPSATGGVVTGNASPLSVSASRPISIPFSSAVGGGSQNATVTLTKTVLKQPLVNYGAKVMRLGSPVGWTILAGTTIAEHIAFEDGVLKTRLQQPSAGGGDYAASPTCPYTYGGNQYSTLAEATSACFTIGHGGGTLAAYCSGNTGGSPSCTPPPSTESCGEVNMNIYPAQNISGLLYTCGVVVALSSSQSTGYQCPNGGTLVGTMCTNVPGTCPAGTTAGFDFFGSGYTCMPNSPVGNYGHPISEAEAAALLDYLTGNDPNKLASLYNDVAGSPATPPTPGPVASSVTTSGPATLTPTTTSTPTPTGRTDTTITPNVTYNNNVINITENVVNNYYNLEGDLIGTDTTTPEPEVANPGTAGTLPEVPDFYEQKYPEGFEGVWNEKKAALTNSGFASLITALTPAFAANGTCPTWTFPGLMMLAGGDISPPCWIWDVVKALLIVTALFVARGLIFGG